MRFPDGFYEERHVSMASRSVNIYDMGHNSVVVSSLPGIVVDYHGISSWICLDEVEVMVSEE